MTQPVTYTRDRVVGAAFEIIREDGWSAVSARSIAKRLGSSTMPIYSQLKSIGEVEQELRVKARALLRDFQRRPWTESRLQNLAFGYVAFARDERHLFRFLFLERPEVMGEGGLSDMKGLLAGEFGEASEEYAALSVFEPGTQEAVIQHTWIFTHGLAVMVNSGTLGECPDETILDFLRHAGEAFYLQALQHPGPSQRRGRKKT